MKSPIKIPPVKSPIVGLTVFVSFFISVGAFTGGSARVEVFDLKRAVDFAVKNSPAFDSIKHQLAVAQLDERSAVARLWPSLDLTATHGLQDTSPRTKSNPWSSELNLALTESLYDNGVTQTNRKIAELSRRIAEFNFSEKKNKLALEIVSKYFAYSLNVKLLSIQENQFKLVSKQAELIAKDFYHGLKTRKDFLRFKAQLNRSEMSMLSAKSDLDKSRHDLLREMGVALSETSSETSAIEFVPVVFEAAPNEAFNFALKVEDNIQYKTAQMQKEMNQLSATLVTRKNMPEWSIAAGLNYTNSNYLSSGQGFGDNSKLGWNALVTLKYNIFDWGIRSRDRQVALLKAKIQTNELDSTLNSLNATLANLQVEVLQSKKTLRLATELLALEKSSINLIEKEYRNGKTGYLDLIAGLENLSDAEVEFCNASYDLNLNHSRVLYHQGRLYEDVLK